MKNSLSWVMNGFIRAELYAPFVVANDTEYISDLRKRYNLLEKAAKDADADEESVKIIQNYSKKVIEAIGKYNKGLISSSHQSIKNLVKGCLNNQLAYCEAVNSDAFPGPKDYELQLFRGRISKDAIPYSALEMLHLPLSLRGLTGNYRFSIPGIPSLYLANSSYACWIELGRPPEHDFVVSPVLLEGNQKIFNLAVMNRDVHALYEFDIDRVHCWLKLLVLMIATSYQINEKDRIFKAEYIISQSIMLACKELGCDGIAYYSKRVNDVVFSRAAVNVALFAAYERGQQYSNICHHIKVGDAYSYAMYKQLGNSIKDGITYQLRCTHSGTANNIGTYDRQFAYKDTYFAAFDQFLFATWKDKEIIGFGNAIPVGRKKSGK